VPTWRISYADPGVPPETVEADERAVEGQHVVLRRSVLIIGLPRWQVVRRLAAAAATVEPVERPDEPAPTDTGDPGQVTAHVPPGWPAEVLPPGVDGWQDTAVAWLLDNGPAEWRQDPVLTRHPVLLARRAAEHLAADVDAARAAWLPADRWAGLGLPADAREPVLRMLAREGPALAARLRAAQMVADALTAGRRWTPRL
jgi:hypothetical protein